MIQIENTQRNIKLQKKEEIIQRVIDGWSAPNGSAQGVLKAEWEIHNNEGFSIDDFNEI